MMKKYIVLLLALIIILSGTLALAADSGIAPKLTLTVRVSQLLNPNVTYTATLTGFSNSAAVPVITFYCDGRALASVPVDKTGTAVYKFSQQVGTYEAVSAWLNTPYPVKSNAVKYMVVW
jgi:hypothetical protein